MPIELICLDADDTLWHNMRHFEAAEDALVALLQPFAEAGIARDRLNDIEQRNLRLYGYGAKGFTLSMVETAIELAGDRLSVGAISDILAAGRTLLAHPVELLAGVQETLEQLHERGRLVLVTKGDLLHQEAKLAASGLGSFFAGVEIVSSKTEETFTRLFKRYSVPADRALMAGDSMRSDILPALAAGAWAAFVPHPIAWSHEAADEPEENPRYRRLERFTELPSLIDAID